MPRRLIPGARPRRRAAAVVVAGAVGLAGIGLATATEREAGTATAGPPAVWVGRAQPARRLPAATEYAATVTPVDPATRAVMTGRSWRPGCPVGLDDLRLVRPRYWGFDGVVRTGLLVVHERWAGALATLFGRLFAARFPIERMQLVDDYGADDDRSVDANNTSAFNCRAVTGGTRWSQHAYGWAIDINPVQNPYVSSSGYVRDPKSRPYADRRVVRPGMIVPGDAVTTAFAAIGWGWGGVWRTIKDYQHFSATGG